MGLHAIFLGFLFVGYAVAQIPIGDDSPSLPKPAASAVTKDDTEPRYPWDDIYPPSVYGYPLPPPMYDYYYVKAQGEEPRVRRDMAWRPPFVGDGFMSWEERGRRIGDYFRAMRERKRNYYRWFG